MKGGPTRNIILISLSSQWLVAQRLVQRMILKICVMQRTMGNFSALFHFLVLRWLHIPGISPLYIQTECFWDFFYQNSFPLATRELLAAVHQNILLFMICERSRQKIIFNKFKTETHQPNEFHAEFGFGSVIMLIWFDPCSEPAPSIRSRTRLPRHSELTSHARWRGGKPTPRIFECACVMQPDDYTVKKRGKQTSSH